MKYIFFAIVYVLSNMIMFNIGFNYGIKTEQRARKRRLAYIKRLLNGKV